MSFALNRQVIIAQKNEIQLKKLQKFTGNFCLNLLGVNKKAPRIMQLEPKDYGK